jgi:uncharacterized OsmC-like protein
VAIQTQKTNGVDLAGMQQTVKAVQDNPKLGQFRFRARNRWLGGTHNRTKIKDFYGAGKEDDRRHEGFELECDEPPILLGEDRGANPVEHLLNALLGCVTSSLVMHAASRGIEIESVESEVEGDLDVRGFLGLTNQVPKGYQSIRVKLRVKSEAEAQKLKELAAYSPVYNTLMNPTPVEIEIEKR